MAGTLATGQVWCMWAHAMHWSKFTFQCNMETAPYCTVKCTAVHCKMNCTPINFHISMEYQNGTAELCTIHCNALCIIHELHCIFYHLIRVHFALYFVAFFDVLQVTVYCTPRCAVEWLHWSMVIDCSNFINFSHSPPPICFSFTWYVRLRYRDIPHIWGWYHNIYIPLVWVISQHWSLT